jgi:hypothetical protein
MYRHSIFGGNWRCGLRQKKGLHEHINYMRLFQDEPVIGANRPINHPNPILGKKCKQQHNYVEQT